MRKKLNVIAMGILSLVMMVSGAHASSEAKFLFRMPGSTVVAAVAPVEPETPRTPRMSAELTYFDFTYSHNGGSHIGLGDKLFADISIKNTGEIDVDFSSGSALFFAGSGGEDVQSTCSELGILRVGETKICELRSAPFTSDIYCSRNFSGPTTGWSETESVGRPGAFVSFEDADISFSHGAYETDMRRKLSGAGCGS